MVLCSFSFVLCSFFWSLLSAFMFPALFCQTFAVTSSITNLEGIGSCISPQQCRYVTCNNAYSSSNVNLLRAEGVDRGESNGGIEASGISILGSAAINRSHSRARQAALPAPRVAFPSVRTISITDLYTSTLQSKSPTSNNRYDDSLQTAEPPSASKPGTALEPSQLDRTCPPHDQERASGADILDGPGLTFWASLLGLYFDPTKEGTPILLPAICCHFICFIGPAPAYLA